MRHLIIALVLATSFLTAPPAAKAADWTNGVISCDINVKELGTWYVPWIWGKWEKFEVLFYLNAAPKDAATFTCRSIWPDNTIFACMLPEAQYLIAGSKLKMRLVMQPTIPSGTSKNAACEIAYNAVKLPL